jgi:hypothetical protein
MKITEFEKILKMTEKSLFSYLRNRFKNADMCLMEDEYILIYGEAPVLLISHLDTVHKETVKTICKSADGNTWMSPEGIGGDDRCGVYALCDVYDKATKKPWLLFTCQEEVGGVGASTFASDYEGKLYPPEMDAIKLIVEVDRKGSKDAVYYDCDVPELEEYITSKGYKTAFGTFTDISIVAPVMGVAAVNLSSGYYNPHTQYEYININEMQETARTVLNIVNESKTLPKYVYVEAVYSYSKALTYSKGWDWYDPKGYPKGYPEETNFSNESTIINLPDYWSADCDLLELQKIGAPEGAEREFAALIDFGYATAKQLKQYTAAYIQDMFEYNFGCDFETFFGEDPEEDPEN